MMSGSQKNIQGSATIWGATVLIALAIVGVAVYVALKQQAPAPQPQPVIAQQQKTPAPVAAPEPWAPEIEQPVPPAPGIQEQAEERPRDIAPEPEPKTGPVRLQLDNLAGTLTLDVPFMKVRNKIPLDHTCYRRNESPALNWAGAPSGTQSYVVFLERRTGSEADQPFVNWLLFNIPAGTEGLKQAQLPAGALHAMSDHNNTGYIGPCEPKGKLTYALRVFALDTMLDLPAGVGKYDLIRAMNGHIIDAAEQEFIHYKLL